MTFPRRRRSLQWRQSRAQCQRARRSRSTFRANALLHTPSKLRSRATFDPHNANARGDRVRPSMPRWIEISELDEIPPPKRAVYTAGKAAPNVNAPGGRVPPFARTRPRRGEQAAVAFHHRCNRVIMQTVPALPLDDRCSNI